MLNENNPILEEVNLKEWHDAGYTGKGVNALVLDLNGKILDEMKTYAEIIDPAKVMDNEEEHNTFTTQVNHVSAPDGHIYVAPWTHSQNEIKEWVRKNHKMIDIVNVSLSSPRTDAFDIFRELDIPLCASSGNYYKRHRMGVSFPADEDWTIAVGAYNWRDKGIYSNDVVDYSNGGEALEAVAPTNVHVKNGKGDTIVYTGTSTSSPFLAGMLMCYIQWRKENGLPKLGCMEAVKYVQEHCKDLRSEGFDYDTGYGLFMMPEIPKVEPPNVEPTPAKVAKTKSDTPLIYEVRLKNSVSGISKKYGVSKSNIVKWNSLKTDKLTTGQYLFLEDPAKIIKILEQTPL